MPRACMLAFDKSGRPPYSWLRTNGVMAAIHTSKESMDNRPAVKSDPWGRFCKPGLVVLAAHLLARLHLHALPSGEEGNWILFDEFVIVFPTILVISAIGAVLGYGTRVGRFFVGTMLFVVCFAATLYFCGK